METVTIQEIIAFCVGTAVAVIGGWVIYPKISDMIFPMPFKVSLFIGLVYGLFLAALVIGLVFAITNIPTTI